MALFLYFVSTFDLVTNYHNDQLLPFRVCVCLQRPTVFRISDDIANIESKIDDIQNSEYLIISRIFVIKVMIEK